MDNLNFDKIQRINVTHETTMPVGFCSVTFLNKQINNPETEMKGKTFVMPPTLKKLMGHIAFGACVRGWVRAWVGVSHFLYLL